ncbi:hypothetical protein PoB_006327300 [Plakobranchus ocellatus]|uniref:Uncharacterized protein n=1 Tax=Plakobranchus ocellatus TaxID=259542 RepID=A0AAV4CXX0_9GAST|nr:hypothetical protein PoB_006327300 [Plakobranchus ocellatus]
MPNDSRDAHKSFEKAFQSDRMEELKLIDLPFLSHANDNLNEVVILYGNLSILSISLTLTAPESARMSYSCPTSLDLSTLSTIATISTTDFNC